MKKEKKVKEYYGRWGTLAIMRETAEERIVSKIRVGITKKCYGTRTKLLHLTWVGMSIDFES